MKRSRIATKSLVSKHNLPEDLWLEVLLRLPVKTLKRFRCVSKHWRSIIDDPDFCRSHLKTLNNNRNETHLFVRQWQKESGFVVRHSNTFRHAATLASPESHAPGAPAGDKKIWSVLCSVDGLVLLTNRSAFEPYPSLLLWNPSIRKSRYIPPLPEESSSIERYIDMGFGYDPQIEDYKLVRLAFDHDQGQVPCWVGVYTVGSGSWKRIQYRQTEQLKNPSYYLYDRRTPVCFGGYLYMFATKNDQLVQFDLTSESFSARSLPEVPGGLGSLALFDGGSSLAALHANSTHVSVWVLESSCSNDWKKRFTFAQDLQCYYRPLYAKKSCAEVLASIGKMTVSCNAESKQTSVLLSSVDTRWISAYVESLVQP